MLPNITWVYERHATVQHYKLIGDWEMPHCWFVDLNYYDHRIGLVINDDGTVEIDGAECSTHSCTY